jgi:hypothetical protein
MVNAVSGIEGAAVELAREADVGLARGLSPKRLSGQLGSHLVGNPDDVPSMAPTARPPMSTVTDSSGGSG